jgi:tRNA(fMet)-specific endonuclease VapC
LDTNIAIALLNGDPEVAARWSEVDEALIPAPVLGELLYGARHSSRQAENEAAVRALAMDMTLVPCDETVCDRYASIKAQLAQDGQPIPENDIWIAACAAASSAALVTRDSHFSVVDGLYCVAW